MPRLAALLFASFLFPGAWAADPAKDKATWLDMRASELIGKHVASPQGKSLGKIEVYPVNAFVRDEYRDRIVVDVERKQLRQSEGFERSNWPFRPPLARASELRGKNVRLKDGRPGEIEDVVVNLGSGKVRGVIVAVE